MLLKSPKVCSGALGATKISVQAFMLVCRVPKVPGPQIKHMDQIIHVYAVMGTVSYLLKQFHFHVRDHPLVMSDFKWNGLKLSKMTLQINGTLEGKN